PCRSMGHWPWMSGRGRPKWCPAWRTWNRRRPTPSGTPGRVRWPAGPVQPPGRRPRPIMGDQDWTEAAYVRVFVTFPADYPAVWRDNDLLAWWLRLLFMADRVHPAAAPWPRSLPD